MADVDTFWSDPPSAASVIYAALGPAWTSQEEALDYPLMELVECLADPLEDFWEVAHDWGLMFDPDLAPASILAWMAQFVGARYPGDATEDQIRTAIRVHENWQRGRPAAIKAALAAELTGTKTIIFSERSGGAYRLQIRTLTSETPSIERARQAILSQKPAGLVLDYDVQAGIAYSDMDSGYDSYGDIDATGDTYEEIASEAP